MYIQSFLLQDYWVSKEREKHKRSSTRTGSTAVDRAHGGVPSPLRECRRPRCCRGRNSRACCCDSEKKQGAQECLRYVLFWGRKAGEYGFPYIFKNKQWKDTLKNDQMVTLGGKCGRQNNGKPKMSVPQSLDPTNKWPCMTKGTSEDVIKVQDSDMWRWSLKSREPLLAVGREEDLAANEGSERCCCVWRQRKRAKECGQPLEARNSKETGPPQSLQKGPCLNSTLILVQYDLCQTDDLRSCKMIKLGCLQPWRCWGSVTAAIGNATGRNRVIRMEREARLRWMYFTALALKLC